MMDAGAGVVRLRSVGVSATRTRRLVLAVLDGRDLPASACEVYDRLRADNANVALTTVYRALHLLAHKGLVHVFAGDEQRYRLCAATAHIHLICRRCGAVLEAPAEIVRGWLQPPGDRDFDVDVESTVLHGLCGRCRFPAPAAPAVVDALNENEYGCRVDG